jgi:hypothetical protein
MVFLTKIVYMCFFALADLILYSKLNKTKQINSNTFCLAVIIFLAVAALHTKLFDLAFLTSGKNFYILTMTLVQLVVFHFVGVYVIYRKKRSKFFPSEVVSLSIKIQSFLFSKLIYIVILIFQCIFIVGLLE